MKDTEFLLDFYTIIGRIKGFRIDNIYKLKFPIASVYLHNKRLKYFFYNKRLKYFVFNFLCSEMKSGKTFQFLQTECLYSSTSLQ